MVLNFCERETEEELEEFRMYTYGYYCTVRAIACSGIAEDILFAYSFTEGSYKRERKTGILTHTDRGSVC